MTLIADSGSTKTRWCVSENGKILAEICSQGISPFYMTETEIFREISVCVAPYFIDCKIDKVFFYGAGCAFEENKNTVKRAVSANFPLAEVEISSDLLGAARALFGVKAGIACILGTGSNSCYYDGKNIVQNVSPLGYVLGDEGSGAVLGKTLVADVLKNQFPPDLTDMFFEKYRLSAQQIIENVYRAPFPNRFLASFVPFLAENIENPQIYLSVKNEFIRFFTRNLQQYAVLRFVPTGFIGSVAVQFSEILKQAAVEFDLEIEKIEKCPVNGLIEFHNSKTVSRN